MIPVVAHGLGDAAALPLPLPLVLVGAGGAVLGLGASLARRSEATAALRSPGATAAAVRARQAAGATGGRTPAGRDTPGAEAQAIPAAGPCPPADRPAVDLPGVPQASEDGWPLPAWVAVLIDAPATRLLLASAGLLGAVAVLILASVGPAEAEANPAPRLVLVVVWAGLIPLSLLAPGAWRAISPLRAVTALLARLSGDPEERGVRALPEGLGWWPAAAAFGVLVLIEGPLQNELPALLTFLVVYALVQVGLAAMYGSRWYAHAEAFEVLAAIVGRLSPLGRGSDGRLRVASPLRRLSVPAPRGTVAVVGILVGSALADFVTDTPAWSSLAFGRTGLVRTALLLGCVAVAIGLAAVAAGARPLTPALLPVVTGYVFAHYFAVFLIEGQAALSQLSATLGGGLRTMTAADLVARYDLLPGPLAASVQLLGFLVPHLVAVLVGHRLAVTHYGARRARAAQAPLLSVLAISAVAGIALRYSAG